ncbi:hypothetical protein U1Q18_008957 [Sarracenia purpurea var. burkii]
MIQRQGASKTPIYWWFFQVVLVWVFFSFVIWLSFIPKNPTFTIEDLYVPALNSSNSTVVHRREVVANTSLAFNFQISNPNKGMGIHYSDIFVTLYHRDATIGLISVPGFYQAHKKSFRRSVRIDIHGPFFRGIADGFVDARLRLETAVEFQIFRWKMKKRQMVLEAFLGIDAREKIIKFHHITS